MNLLENFKNCPRCKSGNLKLKAEKRIICSDCEFTYFHNTAAAVAAIIENDSKILLVTRAHEPQASMLDLPGGFVDVRENAEQALKREIHEELNLEIEDIRYFTTVPNTYFYKDILYYVLDILFTCRAANLDMIKPRDDVADYQFIKPEDIQLKKLAFESTRTALPYYIKNH